MEEPKVAYMIFTKLFRIIISVIDGEKIWYTHSQSVHRHTSFQGF